MNTLRNARIAGFFLLLGLVSSQSGCASAQGTRAGEGAAIGAAGGAVLGAVLSRDGSTAKGAILGAVIGGAAGAAIGSRMDKQADDLADDLEDAEVERVGEGIQVTFDSGILFGFDSDDLKPEARANLSQLLASLDEYPGTDVLIVGHTDATGGRRIQPAALRAPGRQCRAVPDGPGSRWRPDPDRRPWAKPSPWPTTTLKRAGRRTVAC